MIITGVLNRVQHGPAEFGSRLHVGIFYCKRECCQQEDTLDERNMRNVMRILEENEMSV